MRGKVYFIVPDYFLGSLGQPVCTPCPLLGPHLPHSVTVWGVWGAWDHSAPQRFTASAPAAGEQGLAQAADGLMPASWGPA